MMIQTHQKIDPELCGAPTLLEEGFCRVEMHTIDRMAADATGLVHGGFIFGLADYAAMLAVNHPNVVLGGASVRFLKPVKTGDLAVCEARVLPSEGKKKTVTVTVSCGGKEVLSGELTCFVLDRHVLA
ncbi:MAG: PaaI family thioesterase [Pseudomonadota bacterium]